MTDEDLDNLYKEYGELTSSAYADEARLFPRLLHLAIEVTQKCNAKCEHCSISCDAEIKNEELSTDEIKKAIRDIAERYDPSTVSIGFTGGEPLIRTDLIEIAEYARNLGFGMSITTNGVLLTDKMIEKLYQANVRCVAVSIDGLQKTHENFRKLPGCYPKLLKSLRKILEYNDMTVGVTTVVSKKILMNWNPYINNLSILEFIFGEFLPLTQREEH